MGENSDIKRFESEVLNKKRKLVFKITSFINFQKMYDAIFE